MSENSSYSVQFYSVITIAMILPAPNTEPDILIGVLFLNIAHCAEGLAL